MGDTAENELRAALAAADAERDAATERAERAEALLRDAEPCIGGTPYSAEGWALMDGVRARIAALLAGGEGARPVRAWKRLLGWRVRYEYLHADGSSWSAGAYGLVSKPDAQRGG